MVGILGVKPSRNFKIFRTDFPAIFRFDGRLFQERFNIDLNELDWVEIDEKAAECFLKSK